MSGAGVIRLHPFTASQRSHYTKRRKEIWQALHPTPPQRFDSVFVAIGEQHGHAQEKAFAAETAAITGESKSQINRHIARAEALGDDLPRVTGTSLNRLRRSNRLALADGAKVSR
ncbi:MAG: hypothetical protein ABIR35_06265 [Polaromonas sp.]